MFKPQQKELPRKPSNIIELFSQRLEEDRRPKRKSLGLVATFCFMTSVISILGTPVYGQVQLVKLTEQLNPITEQMEEQRGLCTQLKVKSDSHVTLQVAEMYVKDQLGASKVAHAQVKCIKPPPGDEGRVLDPSAAGSWWTSAQSSLQNLPS